jgi:hypothetical protein
MVDTVAVVTIAAGWFGSALTSELQALQTGEQVALAKRVPNVFQESVVGKFDTHNDRHPETLIPGITVLQLATVPL